MASGRHWRIAIDSLGCEGGTLLVGAQIRYRGPKGLVEAPVLRVTDGGGKVHLPRSLVWRRGTKAVAEWLSGGGVTHLQAEDVGELQLRFDLRDAAGDLRLEAGDIPGFALTSRRAGACDGLLKPEQLKTPSTAAPAKGEAAKTRIYRGSYPCVAPGGAVRSLEAAYPPVLPRQLLLFGRGYLPAAREIALPMGSAPAQSYAYSGPDELDPVEHAARRAIAADFPRHRGFVFNWGVTRVASGNEVYSIGLYDLRPCP